MNRLPYVFRSLFPVLYMLLLFGCVKQETPKKVVESKVSVVRLDAMLQEKSTRLQGGIQIDFSNPKNFEGNGWEIRNEVLSAVRKRVTIDLPHLPVMASGAFLKFRARLSEDPTPRSMAIQSGNRQLLSVVLRNGWNEYQTVLPPGGKKVRFIFDGKKSTTGSFGDFANFQLQFYSYSPFKVRNEVRPSILLPASASVSFQVQVPNGNPFLSLGVGLHGDNQEQHLSVVLKEDSLTKTQEFPASSSQWRDHLIDLSEFAGKQVKLEFKSSGKAGSRTPATWLTAWSNPEIVDMSAKREGPNIILFSIDALRWDHLSHYGYSIKTSPNLDMLARRSTVFRNAYCTSPSTLPSHASVMTGLYVAQHHVGTKTKQIQRLQRIPDNLMTLAELATQKNYRTAAITDNGYVSSLYGFHQGFQQYVENNDVEKNEIVKTIDDAIVWVNKNSSRPFFLFLHSNEVHEPFTPPLSAFRHLFPDYKLKDVKSHETHNDRMKDVMRGKVIPTPEEKDLIRKAFDAEIYFFDQQFGRFLKELQNLRLDQNTVLVIFSDHGQQFFERGNGFGHPSSLVPEEIRVPLILYVPGKAYKERKELVSLVDIYSTVASLLGVKIQSRVDGINLMEGGKQFQHRAIFYEISLGEKILWGMQDHQYKLLIDSADGSEYLFDLQNDPAERENLASLSHEVMKIRKGLLFSYIERSSAEPRF